FSLFKLIDETWHASTGSEPLHRICTMMRWMAFQSVVIEDLDGPFEETERIFQEIAAIRKRLACTISTDIRKLTFLQLRIRDEESMEEKIGKVNAALDNDFLGYVIVVNPTIKEHI